jgi:hypothetical protein
MAKTVGGASISPVAGGSKLEILVILFDFFTSEGRCSALLPMGN